MLRCPTTGKVEPAIWAELALPTVWMKAIVFGPVKVEGVNHLGGMFKWKGAWKQNRAFSVLR